MASRLVLCIGDLFIPDRVASVARLDDAKVQFKKLLTPGKIGQVLCLGNLTDGSTHEYLRSLAPELHIVKGDYDVFDSPANLPLSKVVVHGSLRIGMMHGHTVVPSGDADALLIAARQLDVDVLLWAGTHRVEAYEMEGKFFVNPGSATGALSTGWWPDGEDPTPSFVLMDVSRWQEVTDPQVQGEVLVIFVYQLKKDEATGEDRVSVEKVSFRKPAATGRADGAGQSTAVAT